MKKPLLITALALPLAFVSCMTTEQIAPPVAVLGSSSPNLVEGRALYLGQCTKCHSPEPVSNHSDADWHGDIIPEMCKKAKLTPAQQACVLAYVMAARRPEVQAAVNKKG